MTNQLVIRGSLKLYTEVLKLSRELPFIAVTDIVTFNQYSIADFFPEVEVVLDYSKYQLTKKKKLIAELAKSIKDLDLQDNYLAVNNFLLKDGKIYVSPIETTINIKVNLQCDTNHFWTSLSSCKKKPVDFWESDFCFLKSPKFNINVETTHVLRKYKLSKLSSTKLSYYDLDYKFQDGRTQIWMNEDIVVKMSFDKTLYEHELKILQLGIKCLPRLIDYWSNKGENFIIMNNCGITLAQEYVFEILLPSEVKIQKDAINTQLKLHGLMNLDEHLNNYVIRNGIVTMIDCETIIDIEDAEAFRENKPDHVYQFDEFYYSRVL